MASQHVLSARFEQTKSDQNYKARPCEQETGVQRATVTVYNQHTYVRSTHPINIELIAPTRNILLIYKHHIIVNHKMDQLQEPGGMGNDFWRVPVSESQSP